MVPLVSCLAPPASLLFIERRRKERRRVGTKGQRIQFNLRLNRHEILRARESQEKSAPAHRRNEKGVRKKGERKGKKKRKEERNQAEKKESQVKRKKRKQGERAKAGREESQEKRKKE